MIWLSLLSFSKTEAKSGKLCFLFKFAIKVSIHLCLAMLHFNDLNDYKIRNESRWWGPVVIIVRLTWELRMLKRCSYPHLVTCVTSSLSDGAHSSLWCRAIHASSGVSGAVTERLWGTNTSLLCFCSWSETKRQTIGAGLLQGVISTDESCLSACESCGAGRGLHGSSLFLPFLSLFSSVMYYTV